MSRRKREEKREELKTIRGGDTKKKDRPSERKREERKAVAGVPEDPVEEAREQIEAAKQAIEQAESYAKSGAQVTWQGVTYDLSTTQGWKDYNQAIREAKSDVRAAERQIKQYEFQEITRAAPTPKAPAFISIAEVGPPKIATPSDVARLRAEGYDLPEGKTIYINPSGQPYYYEGEIEEPEKALSLQLWEEAELLEEAETGNIFGIPYSKKGVRQIGAVLAGSLEQSLTPILRVIPGEQPFELVEGEVGFSWRDVEGADQLDETEQRIAKLTGIAGEAGARIVSMAGVTYFGGVVIGASGAAVSRIPTIGSALEKGGAFLANKLNTPLGKIVLIAPIAAIETKKTLEMVELGKDAADITAELLLDASSLYGAAIGVSRGLAFGKTIPARVERLVKGGTTIPEAAFTPEYEGFPKFSEEPYPPTAKGYKEMAEAYTPEELRIADETIPSYHATAGRLEAETGEGFITQIGKRPGEGGMFYAPAGSKHFLRLESGYSLEPGMPNIFSEPKWVYGEFPGVVETGLSKSSPELAKILEESAETGKLFMPAEQLEEAQAILGPGVEMAKVKEGRFWADMGGKIVKIERYLPKQLAEFAKVETVKIESLETLLSKQAATESYLYGPQKAVYLPVLDSSTLLKKADVSLSKIEISKITSSSKVSKISSTLDSSLKKADSRLSKISSDISVLTTPKTYPSEPSHPSPRYQEPSITIPEPTEPSYPSEPSYPPTYPSPKYQEPSYTIPEPSYPSEPSYPPMYPQPRRRKAEKEKGKKRRKAAYEFRVDFKEPKITEIGEITFKEPKIKELKL